MRAPGGSFIWPYTSAHFEPLVEPLFFFGSTLTFDLDHLVIEVVALTRTLADAGEHRVAAVHLGDVVDELHDEHGLAHAGAAEQPDLAALGVGSEQVDDLDARDQDLRFRRLIGEAGRGLMDGAHGVGVDRTGFVHRLADDVDDAAQRLLADRHHDRLARVDDLLAAHETFRRVSMAIVRTVFSPRCCATSRTRRLPWFLVSSEFKISGRCSSNCTSTTAPITWRTLPTLLAIFLSSQKYQAIDSVTGMFPRVAFE